MPDPQKQRILSDEELDAIFGGAPISAAKPASQISAPVAQPTGDEVSGGRHMRPGMLPFLGGHAARLAGGLVSGVVGAVPSFVTTPTAAAIGGLGETIAEKIESPDPVDKSAVALEAGLSAIPLSKVYKGFKLGGSLGKQLIANMMRGAALNEASTVARRYNTSGNLLPQSGQEALYQDVPATALGGLFGALGMGRVNNRIAGAAEDVAPGTIPTDPEAQLVAGMTSGPKQPANLIKKPTTGPMRTDVMQKEPIGLPRATVKPNAPVENRGLIVKGRSVGEVGGAPLPANARTAEGIVPPRPGVANEQATIAARPSKLKGDQLDSDGIARRPESVAQGLHEEVNKAADIAKVERKANEKDRAAEQKLLDKEQRADQENLRNRAGATDLGKQKVAAQKAENQMLDASQQEANKLRTLEKKAQAEQELKTRQENAQGVIDKLLDSGEAVEGPTVLSETTEKVPTASGNQVLKTTIIRRPPEEPTGTPIDDVDMGPAPTPATPVERLDPAVVAASTYGTEKKALQAIAGTGKRGTARPLGKGKWGVVFEEETPKAETPVAPTPAPKTRGVAPVAPQKPVVTGKGEAPPAPTTTPVEPAKALPEAPTPPPEAPPAAAVPVKPKPKPKGPSSGAVADQKAAIEAEVNQPPFKPGVPPEEVPPQVSKIADQLRASLDADAARRAAKGGQAPPPEAPPEAPPAAPVPAKPKPAPKGPKGRATAAERLTDVGGPMGTTHERLHPTADNVLPQTKAEGAAAPKMKRAEIDALTREDVAKWRDDEIAQARAKYLKDKRLQTILADEVARRQKATTKPQNGEALLEARKRLDAENGSTKPTRGVAPVSPQKTPKAGGFEGPDREPSMPAETPAKPVETTAAGIPKTELKPGSKNAYEQMAQEASTPEGAVTLDLTGAQTGGEVRNRIVNELHKYRAEVKASEDARGVDEKGQYTYPVPIPEPRTIVVPGGPTYRFKPELQQIDNAIEALEKGATVRGASGRVERAVRIEPEDAFKGIVDETPRKTTVTIKPGYGSNFNAKSGSAPGYKLPIGPAKEGPISSPPVSSLPERVTNIVKGMNDAELAATEKALGVKDPITAAAKAEAEARVAKAKAEGPEALNARVKKGAADYLAGKSPEDVAAAEARVAAAKAKKAGTPPAEAPKPETPPADINDLAMQEKTAWDEYWRLKELGKTGKATNEQIRAAGKAAGDIRYQLAKAAKEAEAAGKPVPFAKAPEKASPPPGKGPTNEEISALPPEQQEAALKEVVDTFKKGKSKGKGTTLSAGFGGLGEFIADNPVLAARVGLGTTGALIGSSMTPDDPITGAIIGGGMGLFAPSVFRALAGHVNSLPAGQGDASRAMLANWVKDKVQVASKVIPNLERASLLSKPPNLVINMWIGPYGSAAMGAVERAMAGDRRAIGALRELLHPTTFFKEWWKELDAAKEAVYNANERGDLTGGVGPKFLQNLISKPAEYMTAGDKAAKNILMRHGFTEAEAKQLTLTSEPITPFGKAVGNAQKTKVNGVNSFLLKMALPFYRTNANQWEQSLLRFPVVGRYMRQRLSLTPQSARLTAVQELTSLGVGGIAYIKGKNTPKEQQALTLKFLNNFAGPYGMTASLGFLAGVASQKNEDVANQFAGAAMRLATHETPLPSTDVIVSMIKTGQSLLNLETPALPYGVVPPVISSKENFNIPELERWVVGDPEHHRPTVEEYGPLVPFADNPQLKPKPKSADEIEMDQMKQEMNQMRQDREYLKERRRLRQEQRDMLR